MPLVGPFFFAALLLMMSIQRSIKEAEEKQEKEKQAKAKAKGQPEQVLNDAIKQAIAKALQT